MLPTDTARITVDGRPMWLLPTGRTIPVIHGAADDGDPDPTPPADPPAADDPPLGPAGEKALNAWKERAKAAEAAAGRVPDLERELNELRTAQMTDQEKALAAARDEAAQAARAEVLGQVNSRLFTAELRAAAAAANLLPSATQDLLVDPIVALRLLGLDEYPVTVTGDINSEAISQHVAAYVAARPHLAAGAMQPPGPVDQGARPATPAKTLADQIAEAEAAGNWKLSGQLKTRMQLAP